MNDTVMEQEKRATANDVARAAGVSKWTVNRAFTPGASIREESKARILAAAEKLGYRPNLLARSLAKNQTHQIAVLVDDFRNPFKLPFLAALSQALQEKGMVMVLININEQHDHIDALMDVDQRQLDAAILLGTDFRDAMLTQQGGPRPHLPLYVLARESTISTIPHVTCDSEIAMREICDHLWARGYRRPGFMTGPRTLSTALGRRRNFLANWENRGVQDVPVIQAGSYDRDAAIRVLRQYRSSTADVDWIDVLMCENDALAMGAIDLVRSEFGLDVPRDLAIVGFDDFELVSSPSYDLTSYRQPVEEMVSALVRMIKGEVDKASIAIPGRLIVRSTT
jgi:LacI family transcriptional regulator